MKAMVGTLLAAVAMLLALPAMAGTSAAGTKRKPTVISLWQGSPPADSGHAPARPEHLVRKTATYPGVVTDIAKPRMVVLHPAHPDGTAVLVMGGGGYAVIAIAEESMPAAQWLLKQGVTPVILYYRLPGKSWAPVAPFQDAQRAMRLLRLHAASLGIDPQRIGVLGFSAGGNLAGITATRCKHDFYPPLPKAGKFSSCPDFAALIYPVSSLVHDHSGTRHRLMAQQNAVHAYTVQFHVSDQTPPMFIVQNEDDPVVSVDGSLSLFKVLHEHHVPAEMHLFAKGGHGFGLGKPGMRDTVWPRLFAGWMAHYGWLRAAGRATAKTDREK